MANRCMQSFPVLILAAQQICVRLESASSSKSAPTSLLVMDVLMLCAFIARGCKYLRLLVYMLSLGQTS
jgi:hypothetical protein